jgi:hypothetical protein
LLSSTSARTLHLMSHDAQVTFFVCIGFPFQVIDQRICGKRVWSIG